MRCIENSHYFHYGDPHGKFKAKVETIELQAAIKQSPSWNQQQSAAARDRIRGAIADLLEKNTLPSKATARFRSVLTYGIGGASLYRHRDLWHPGHLSNAESVRDNSQALPSLFLNAGGDALCDEASGDRAPQCDDPPAGNLSGDCTGSNSALGSMQVDYYTQAPLFDLETWQAVHQEADRSAQRQRRQLKRQASQLKQVARMQQFLESDDLILVAEAMAWAAVNPGILDFNQLPLVFGGSAISRNEGS